MMQSVDRHFLDILIVVGLALGVLGSLYLAYGLLGRPHGWLREFTRLLTFALLGGVVFVTLNLLTGVLSRRSIHVARLFTSGPLFLNMPQAAAFAVSGGFIVFLMTREADSSKAVRDIGRDLAHWDSEIANAEARVLEAQADLADLEEYGPHIDQYREQLQRLRAALASRREELRRAAASRRRAPRRSRGFHVLTRSLAESSKDFAELRREEAELDQLTRKYDHVKAQVEEGSTVVREVQEQHRALHIRYDAAVAKNTPRFMPLTKYAGKPPGLSPSRSS